MSRIVKQKRPYTSLHEWLDRTGTPQRVLAKRAGMTDSHLSMLLRGSRRCSLVKAIKLEDITGVPVRNLVRWPQYHETSNP